MITGVLEEQESGSQADQRKLYSLRKGDHAMTAYLEGVTKTGQRCFRFVHMQCLHIPSFISVELYVNLHPLTTYF
jgi:hypothetical protein